MATGTSTKKPCSKCNKGGATFTCDGCHRSFCLKHASDHRQELSQEMDDIGQQHDILKRDIDEQTINKTLLAQINRWEKESIEIIRSSAEQARNDLKLLTEESKTRLNGLMSNLSNELRLNREIDDYTEEDLERWANQLKELRKELDKPSAIKIIDEKCSSISLITTTKTETIQNDVSKASSQKAIRSLEKFKEIIGPVILSNNGCTAICISKFGLSDGPTTYSSVCGCLQYASGSCNVRCRLNTSSGSEVFLGVLNLSQPIIKESSVLKSAYGFWSRGGAVRAGCSDSVYKKIKTQSNDEVVLTLDCSSSKIIYVHERSKINSEIDVDLKICPLPWKLVVTLWHPNDKIEILNS